MFRLFSGGADGGSWPLAKIVSALKDRYRTVTRLGEEGPLSVYGIEDSGINFVVATLQTAPGSGKVTELGFLARFIGPQVSPQLVENINRNLHISVASIEGSDLFLMAGLQVTGNFDESQFALVLEAWRRDLVVTIHGIDGEQASMAASFAAAKLPAAREFATNNASTDGDGDGSTLLSRYLGAKAFSMTVCPECGGRGKRGLIARTCEACGGDGFVMADKRR